MKEDSIKTFWAQVLTIFQTAPVLVCPLTVHVGLLVELACSFVESVCPLLVLAVLYF